MRSIRSKLPFSLFAVLAFILSSRVHAAEFTWTDGRDADGDGGTVSISGEIEFDDHKKLLSAIGDHEGSPGLPVTVKLDSKGGNFEEAFRIAAIIRDKTLTAILG